MQSDECESEPTPEADLLRSRLDVVQAPCGRFREHDRLKGYVGGERVVEAHDRRPVVMRMSARAVIERRDLGSVCIVSMDRRCRSVTDREPARTAVAVRHALIVSDAAARASAPVAPCSDRQYRAVMQTLRYGYVGTAALLGGVWFVVMLVPSTSREWLLLNIPANLACMVLASCAVALIFEDWIAKARTLKQHALRAILLPPTGAAFYLSLFILYGSLASRGHWGDQPAVFVFGMIATVLAAPLFVPFGFVCQFVMNRLARQPYA